MHTLPPILFNIILEVLARATRQEKEIKGIQIRKEDVKLSVCRRQDITYRNPKDSTKKLLELINELSKIAEYKINIQNSTAFLYANNKLFKKEIKKIQFTTASKE